MVASSSSRLKPTASSDQQQQTGGGGGEEELKLLKQQMSALKLDHHLTPVPQTQVVEGEEEDDQVKLLNQKIAQLKLLPGEEEVVQETSSSSVDRARLLLSLEEVLVKRRVRKRLLVLLKDRLQSLRVNVKELKVVKQPKSMRQCRLLKIRDIVAEAQAIKAEAQRIAVVNRRRCHQILDSIERSNMDQYIVRNSYRQREAHDCLLIKQDLKCSSSNKTTSTFTCSWRLRPRVLVSLTFELQ